MIDKLINQTLEACLECVKENNKGQLEFVDPLDHEEISAHYGATHAATAFILLGQVRADQQLLDTGLKLLESILDRWSISSKLPGFHNDFNNFALCLLIDRAGKAVNNFADRIKNTIMSTPDSNNPTVNWYPMRWYVNLCRYEWTGEKKYDARCKKLRTLIEDATYEDGFIDDRTPKGLSFNLQYDVATVAAMELLKVKGEGININKELGALLKAVAPDGDINYLGRGTNQIFAWGLWVYLLSTSSQEEIDRALKFLKDKVPVMLKNHNLMLNDYPGEEKYMWWDYHYCSVYTAHFLLWMALAKFDKGMQPIKPEQVNKEDSGVHIYKNENAFIATFDGRKEYLAERGPVIAAIWTKKSGMVCKGTFGPWQGAFGNKYMQPDAAIYNFAGWQVHNGFAVKKSSRIINKLNTFLPRQESYKTGPYFSTFSVELKDNDIFIKWNISHQRNISFNLPVIEQIEPSNVTLMCGDQNICLINTICVRNQYCINKIYRSSVREYNFPTLQIR